MMNDELMGRFYRAMQAESQEREIPCQRDIFDGCPEASYLIDYARRKDAPIYAVKRLLCANVNVEKSEDCKKPGTFICTKCRLVSYCSKVSLLSIPPIKVFQLQLGVSNGSLANS